MRSEIKHCQSCKQGFTIESEDFDFYRKINVPPPTWCWQCRAMRRMSFRNMRYLYQRTCAATGKKIFTVLPPEAPMPPYEFNYWISDKWNPMDYGKDYDFERPFFEQMKELFHAVPWAPIWQQDAINSEYSVAAFAKNCYLCFDTGYVEDSMYSMTLHDSKQCVDMINCQHCELCYFCINTNKSYKTFFSRDCTSCIDTWFSQDCIGCTSCFGCTGLRNKKYYIFNHPFTKAEYKKKLEEMEIPSWTGIERAREQATAVWKKYPVKYRHAVQVKDCVGDYIYNSAELRNCFFAGNAQNCAHSQSIIYGPIKDSMDISSVGVNVELDYELANCGLDVAKLKFSLDSSNVADSEYVINCRQSSDLFGCVALKSKKYCILNKQYSKEEYKKMVPKIIEHMNAMSYKDAQGRTYTYGEFFPLDMSVNGYNESHAQEYFPLTKQEAEKHGYRWRNSEKKQYKITKTADALPERIEEVKDDIVKEVVQCQHEGKKEHPWECKESCMTALRFTLQELQFYRKLGLPVPRSCFNCRHLERVAWRNKPRLWQRKCMCPGSGAEVSGYKNTGSHFHGASTCPNEFETSYASDRPEIVYCEACYNSEVA